MPKYSSEPPIPSPVAKMHSPMNKWPIEWFVFWFFKSHNIDVEAHNYNPSMFLPDTGAVVVAVIGG